MKSIFFSLVILMAALTQVIPEADAAPQAIALGPRPAVKADPIMIPDEEALGQDLDHVMEAPVEDPIEIKEPEVTKSEAEARKELAGQVVEVYESQDRSMAGDADSERIMLNGKVVEEGKKSIPKEKCQTTKLTAKEMYMEVEKCSNGFCQAVEHCGTLQGCKENPPMRLSEGQFDPDSYMGCNPNATRPADATIGQSDKTFWQLYWWTIVLVVVILLIIIGFLIWFFVRQKKKAALKAQGLNAEVASVTPVQTADGPAQVVNLEPISEGGTASSGQPGQ